MLTVGQLARICNISSKTLRYYDQIGLFTPTAVGEENQYRYYHVGQIELLRRILFLRDLGVGIETIREMEGSYSNWGNLTKVHFPSSVEIFKMTDQQIASYYLKDQAARECVGPAAIRRLATIVKENGIPEYMRAHLAYFSFQLGARRCSDFARFYQEFDPERAKIKEEQGKRFGLAHVTYLKKDYEALYHTLEELAQLEERFIELTLSAANA